MSPYTNDEELIEGVRLQFAESAATLLEEMATHSPCRCANQSRNNHGRDHEVECPIAIWFRAAHTVRMLAQPE
jgi:hypothetical protein